MTDENGAHIRAPKSTSSTPGKRYMAQIYRDGPTARLEDATRKDFVVEERVVTSADTLSLALAPGGGQAIRLVRVR